MDLEQANEKLKAEKARVRIESRSGALRLRATLPPKPGEEYKGRHQQSIYLRLPDSSAAIKQAFKDARLLSAQLVTRTFDWSEWGVVGVSKGFPLKKYWAEYLEQKAALVTNPRTISAMYVPMLNILEPLPPIMTRSDAINFINVLKDRGNSPETIRKRVSICHGFYQWMSDCGYWGQPNPFAGLRKQIKVQPEEPYTPFTETELQKIFEVMVQSPHYSYYVPFYSFLVMTGCRISEGIGLRWGDVSPDYSQISFRSAIVVSGTHKQIRKGSKNSRSRVFYCTEALIELLQTLPRGDKDSLVFPSKTGKPLHQRTLHRRCWASVVKEAKIPYRPQMMLRHTLISHAIQTMAPVDLAAQLGHSTHTMLKHYARSVNPKAVPEIVISFEPE